MQLPLYPFEVVKMKTTEEEKQEAIKELRGLFEKADYKVYTILEHRSQSGMMRYIKAIVIINNEPIGISHLIAKLGHYPRAGSSSGYDGVKVGGCGMDMGFELVYNTSRAVFDEFICLGENCRSNDHVNGDRNREPHKHSDPGYLLKQEWL